MRNNLSSFPPESPENFNSIRRQKSPVAWRLLQQRGSLPQSRRTAVLCLGFVILVLIYVCRHGSNPWASLSTAPSTPFILTRLSPAPKISTETDTPIDLANALSSVSRLTAPKFRPQCGPFDRETRYSTISRSGSNATIFLALDLHNSQWILPTIIHELPILLSFMGSHRFHVSILENGSSDLSPSLLVTLAAVLEAVGVSYEIVVQGKHVKTTQEYNHRIIGLALLRNAVLDSLYTGRAAKDMGIHGFDVVLFLNDIIWCANDVLEVLYEHVKQKAHLTCATDWENDVVYDRWVARTMSGLPLYVQESLTEYFNGPRAYLPPVPRPLPFDDHERQLFEELKPFQVFSCWNGAAVIDAQAFFSGPSDPMPRRDHEAGDRPENSHMSRSSVSTGIRFRTAQNDASVITEKASECFLLSVDLWKKGMGKIMMVPRASVAYNLAQYERVRQDGGRTVRHPIRIEPPRRSRIEASSFSRYAASRSSSQDGPSTTSWNSENANQIQWASFPPQSVVYHDYAWWHEKERWGRWDEA